MVAFFAGLAAGFFAAAGFLAFGFAAFFSAAGFFAAVFFGVLALKYMKFQKLNETELYYLAFDVTLMGRSYYYVLKE
jgi:hypothetical protein